MFQIIAVIETTLFIFQLSEWTNANHLIFLYF